MQYFAELHLLRKASYMINNIQIPKPCHQDWGTMAPNEQGRHCRQCCKTVVDFTSKEPEEIIQYLKEHSGQNVCGRFMSTQLDTPIATEEMTIHIFNSSLSYCKKIAALILITFGIVLSTSHKSFSQTNKTPSTSPGKDSIPTPILLGKIAYDPVNKSNSVKRKPAKKPICITKKESVDTTVVFIAGEIKSD